MITIAALALATAGYLTGRTRPWGSVRYWAWSVIMFPPTERRDALRWRIKAWAAVAIQADRLAVGAWRQWRRRNDPTPQRRPVPVLIRKGTETNG